MSWSFDKNLGKDSTLDEYWLKRLYYGLYLLGGSLALLHLHSHVDTSSPNWYQCMCLTWKKMLMQIKMEELWIWFFKPTDRHPFQEKISRVASQVYCNTNRQIEVQMSKITLKAIRKLVIKKQTATSCLIPKQVG